MHLKLPISIELTATANRLDNYIFITIFTLLLGSGDLVGRDYVVLYTNIFIGY